MRNLFLISIILCITAGNVWGQSKRNSTPAKPASQTNILQFDEADALFGKRKAKPRPPNKAHDKYANQEVSYRKAKGGKPAAIVFEPNDEPLWAKQNKRRKVTATRTETVNNNESLRTRKVRRAKP